MLSRLGASLLPTRERVSMLEMTSPACALPNTDRSATRWMLPSVSNELVGSIMPTSVGEKDVAVPASHVPYVKRGVACEVSIARYRFSPVTFLVTTYQY